MRLPRKIALHAGVNHVDFPIEIDQPKLWFPSGYGEQSLYGFEAGLRIGTQPVDTRKARTGLRSVVLRRDVDAWGRSFEFVITACRFSRRARM